MCLCSRCAERAGGLEYPTAPTNDRRCEDCGAPIRSPFLTGGITVCEHRYACEARQMLARGEPVESAAEHAQQRRPW